MPSLLSKFSKSPNGKLDDDRQAPALHQRAQTNIETGSLSRSRPILSSDSSDSIGGPPSKGPALRTDTLLADAAQSRNSSAHSLYPDEEERRARKAFAEQMRDGSRRALSLGTPSAEDSSKDDVPRRPPSRAVPDPPPPVPAAPTLELPSDSIDIQPPRSRKDSTASPLVESPPSMQSGFPQFGLASPPTSEENHTAAAATAAPIEPAPQSQPKPQPNGKKGWRRPSQSAKRSVHPSGGLASALAGSGLALANHAMQQPLMPPMPPVPPVPPRPRQNSTTPDMPQRLDRHAHSAGSRKSSISAPKKKEDGRKGHASGSSEEDDDDEESSPDELDLREGNTLITGFAVASNKRNADFHTLFPTVPEGDYLIDDYGCALQREILIQGRLYISENHLCFHANILGWTTDLVIPMEDIIQLEKRMTAYVIPNAIQVSARTGKYTFSSLLSRDTTYDVIHNIWRSLLPEGASGSPRGSIDLAGQSNSFGSVTEGLFPETADQKAKISKTTRCACGKEGKHYSETAMETIMPGSPEKIYNLMFASGFMKDFMRNDEKLMDIQISDWIPVSQGSKMLTRNMSYIKPLAGGIGPKQTKCELKDEMIHLDYDDYVSMLTTTRTPDVPSGNVFSVKTRTCLMWATSGATRVIITTSVEWTGRSFIKGIIERSAIDGQKTYHSSLEKAMREFISTHKDEFIAAGEDVDAVEAAAVLVSAKNANDIVLSPEDIRKAKEIERSQRGMQWALDTVEGTCKVAKQSFWGAIELIKETCDSSSTTAVLWFVVVGLVLSNIWTYFRARQFAVATPRRISPKRERDIQQAVGETVRDAFKAFEEVVRGDGKSMVDEIADINRKMEAVDARLRMVEQRLGDLD